MIDFTTFTTSLGSEFQAAKPLGNLSVKEIIMLPIFHLGLLNETWSVFLSFFRV